MTDEARTEDRSCPCGSGGDYEDCCWPVIQGDRAAETPEALMRARYTAYTQVEMDFLQESLHPDYRENSDPEGAKEWAENSVWEGLTVIETAGGGADEDSGTVEFVAAYHYDGEDKTYHEVAHFARHEGAWFFTEGHPPVRTPVTRDEPKVGRNDPCPCGSGRKFKRCCGA